MKWSLLHICLAFVFANVSFATDARGQEILDRKISIQAVNQDINFVLTEIEKNANVRFSYSPNLIKSSRKVSIAVTDEKLSAVLQKLLNPQQIKWEIVGKQIILKRDISEIPKTTETSPNASAPEERAVSGKITDENGEAMVGVNILEKGTNKGTNTNAEGKYTINVKDEKSILIFSFVGFYNKEVVVGNRQVLNVSLDTDN